MPDKKESIGKIFVEIYGKLLAKDLLDKTAAATNGPTFILNNPPHCDASIQCPDTTRCVGCMHNNNPSLFITQTSGSGVSGTITIPSVAASKKVFHECDKCGGWESQEYTFGPNKVYDVYLVAPATLKQMFAMCYPNGSQRNIGDVVLCKKCWEKVYPAIKLAALSASNTTTCQHEVGKTPILGRLCCKKCGEWMS